MRTVGLTDPRRASAPAPKAKAPAKGGRPQGKPAAAPAKEAKEG